MLAVRPAMRLSRDSARVCQQVLDRSALLRDVQTLRVRLAGFSRTNEINLLLRNIPFAD